MGGELPPLPGGTGRVLYPASCRASDDLQRSLEASGFGVERLNTYDTRSVQPSDVPPPALAAALAADAVTFGSPSAVKAWIALVGLAAAGERPAACIGATSARACEAAGLTRIFFPEAPGIDGWVTAVTDALQQQQQQRR
jgi:uroporphyrinogen-III synthase